MTVRRLCLWAAAGAALAGAAGTAAILRAQQAPAPPERAAAVLARWFPEIPQVYLQVRDAGALIDRFRASPRRMRYEEGRNFEDFKKSRLYRKLELRIRDMGESAGFGITVENLRTFLGTETALWLYDIGELKFVAATRLPGTRFAASALSGVAGRFEERTEDGLSYRVRVPQDGGPALLYARVGDLLVFGTDPDRFLPVAVSLRTRPDFRAASAEVFSEAFDRDFVPHDATLFFTRDALASVHFRTYWVYRNAKSLAAIESGLADLEEAGDRWIERRVFNVTGPAEPPPAESARLAALLDADPCYARVEMDADPAAAAAALGRELFGGPGVFPVEAVAAALAPAGVRGWAAGAESRFEEDLFLSWRRFVAVELGDPARFDAGAFRDAVGTFVSSRLLARGAAPGLIPWAPAAAGSLRGWVMEPPLFPDGGIAFAVAGDLLVCAGDAAGLSRAARPPARPLAVPRGARSFVSADTARLWRDYRRSVSLLAARDNWPSEEGRSFFSGNIVSLGAWADPIARMTVERRAGDGRSRETVTYLRGR